MQLGEGCHFVDSWVLLIGHVPYEIPSGPMNNTNYVKSPGILKLCAAEISKLVTYYF